MSSKPPETWRRLRRFALDLPSAYEDHPWDETVAKVGKKVFVFLGTGDPPGLSVKIKDPAQHKHALSLPGSRPTEYGLGKSGWVSISLDEAGAPFELLSEFIEESYRAIASKKLNSQLDEK